MVKFILTDLKTDSKCMSHASFLRSGIFCCTLTLEFCSVLFHSQNCVFFVFRFAKLRLFYWLIVDPVIAKSLHIFCEFLTVLSFVFVTFFIFGTTFIFYFEIVCFRNASSLVFLSDTLSMCVPFVAAFV